MASSNSHRYVWRICLIAAMGGLLFGYDWVVIGGAKPFYEPHFGIHGDERAWMAGWTMGSALAGCLVGALASAVFTDRYGRKRALMVAALLFTTSAVWTALAASLTGFIIARILGGVGIGLASSVSPMYIAEIAPADARGRLVSINQLTIVIGVLAAQIVNLMIYNWATVGSDATAEAIVNSWSGQYGWRWMFAAETVPAASFLLLLFWIPESPRWLLSRGRVDEAQRVLQRLGSGPQDGVEENPEIATDTVRFGAELFQPKVLGVLVFGVFIAVFQQWCGINVIFNYAEEIFRAAGYDLSGLMLNIVITGIVNLLFTFVAMYTVDRWGRRPLMLLGAGGLALVYTAMGACYYYGVTGPAVLGLVLTAIAIYAMTLAPITWVLLSEVFPTRIRGTAMSICVSALWIACFLLTSTFKPINVSIGAAGTFWLYGGICLVGFMGIFVAAPETKGRSLEEIELGLTAE